MLDLLDLVALGTVADVARLKGLNRAFVTQGLQGHGGAAEHRPRGAGRSRAAGQGAACRDLGFALGPRINAGGRVGKSDLGVRLLTSTDAEEARGIAAELDRLNEERRAIEMLGLRAGRRAGRGARRRAVIIVMSARLAPGRDRHRRRAAQGALRHARRSSSPKCEDGTGKGSGRSISRRRPRRRGARRQGKWAAVAGGGHAMAAGLTLRAGGLEPFRDFINERLAADVEKSRGDRALLLDALLAPGGVAGALCDALDAAGPYGAGWPSPRVAAGPARLLKTGIVGDGHVRGIACGDDGKSFKWIAFRSAATDARPGLALIARRPALVARRIDQARRMERRQCGGDARRRRRPCLTLQDPSPNPRAAFAAPSSSGLGRRPFTAKTRVRVPLGSPG